LVSINEKAHHFKTRTYHAPPTLGENLKTELNL